MKNLLSLLVVMALYIVFAGVFIGLVGAVSWSVFRVFV
jgi:hypothetical protein